MASIGERFSKARLGYLSITPGALFTLGLIVSHNFVEYACVMLLVNFYGEKVERQKYLAKAAMLLCFQEGLVSLCSILYARLIDSHLPRRFYAILVSTGSYISGLALLFFYSLRNPKAINFPIFFVSAFFIALGRGGKKSLLLPFLADKLGENDESNQNENNKKQTKLYKNTLLRIAWVVGAIIAIFGLLGAKWKKVFKVSSILMGVTGFLFLFGSNKESDNSLNVAASVENPSQSIPEQHQLSGGRYLRFLLISSCTAYSMLLAAGNTILQEQGDMMGSLRINGKEVRFSVFLVIQAFVSDITALVFWLSGWKKQRITLVRIGSGMVCAIVCCLVAWKVAMKSQVTTSVIWLSPQYVLLGLVDGLSQGGLERLFEDHQVKPFKEVCRTFTDLVSCSGYFISIPVILIVRSWFRNFDTGQSHLGRYYVMLGVFCSVFLCIYVCVACLYAKHMKPETEDMEGAGSNIRGRELALS